jgi:FAD/FMN-containing dehydrogenase
MSHPHPVIADLQSIVGAKGIVSDPQELLVYECDGFPIAKGMPVAVVFPTTTEQVSQCMKTIARHGLAIVPRGTGTGLAGGCVAFEPGVIVSTSRMTVIGRGAQSRPDRSDRRLRPALFP